MVSDTIAAHVEVLSLDGAGEFVVGALEGGARVVGGEGAQTLVGVALDVDDHSPERILARGGWCVFSLVGSVERLLVDG